VCNVAALRHKSWDDSMELNIFEGKGEAHSSSSLISGAQSSEILCRLRNLPSKQLDGNALHQAASNTLIAKLYTQPNSRVRYRCCPWSRFSLFVSLLSTLQISQFLRLLFTILSFHICLELLERFRWSCSFALVFHIQLPCFLRPFHRLSAEHHMNNVWG
jgi:hypothetical protein